jgi:hypothetical protein
VLGGAPPPPPATTADVEAALQAAYAAGADQKRAVGEVAAALDVSRRVVYAAAIRLRDSSRR